MGKGRKEKKKGKGERAGVSLWNWGCTIDLAPGGRGGARDERHQATIGYKGLPPFFYFGMTMGGGKRVVTV